MYSILFYGVPIKYQGKKGQLYPSNLSLPIPFFSAQTVPFIAPNIKAYLKISLQTATQMEGEAGERPSPKADLSFVTGAQVWKAALI